MTIHERDWSDRPFDVSNLLNPAFLGIVLRKCTEGFVKEDEEGLPFELAFLVFPLVLHEPTRSLLPATTRTKMHPWLQENREVLVQFGDRARELVPFVREAVMFCIKRQVVDLSVSGRFTVGPSKLKTLKKLQATSDEVYGLFKKAEFTGRWLKTGGPSANIYAMLGVRP